MLRDLTVAASLEPRAIDVAWAYAAPGTARPPFRLVRRLGGHPERESDGVLVLELDELFQLPAAPATPWARVERLLAVARNGPANDPELIQGAVALFFPTAASAEPSRVTVAWFDETAGVEQAVQIDEVSRVVETPGPVVAPFTVGVTLEIFATPGGGPEVSEGVVTLRDFLPNAPAPPPVPAELRWAPAVGPAVTVRYHRIRAEATTSSGSPRFETRDATAGVFGPPPVSAPLLRAVRVDAEHDPSADVTEWRVSVRDRGLVPGSFYYYRLFTAVPFSLGAAGTGTALATADYGAHERMYRLLPPVHQIADLETAPPGGQGQLYRFLAPFGAALDHVHGLVESLPDRHDIAAARVDTLPHLSRMIGWTPDLAAPAATQRQDVGFAAELFAAVGTLRNPPAVVNRVTGWPCAVKEFAHNVVLTNAPESQTLWEIWQATRTAGVWGPPSPLALTTSADGDPVALAAGGTPWVIWQSDRSGRRELWFQRLGVDAEPQRVMAGAPDDAPEQTFADEGAAAVADGANVVLFWSSDRSGNPEIWTRTMTPAPGPAVRLSVHARADRNPAAVRDGATLWLFWDSDRRGVSDIWSRRLAGGVWSAESRLLKDAAFDHLHDTRPAAVVAPNGELWLFWCRDRGDRREIWHQANSGGVWGPQLSLGTDLLTGQRDEAPCPVADGARVVLLFHSNRGGPWQIWSRVHDGVAWQPATRASDEPTADKEPAAFVDAGGDLQVFWSSQRRAPWYRSRTLDFDDVHMLAEMGTFNDHTHYVYDTGLGPNDWYARGTVGLYLTPDTTDPAKIAAAVERADAFLEPFRPAPVRFTWPAGDVTLEEPIEVGDLLGEDWSDGP